MIDDTLATDVRAIASLHGEFRLRSGQLSTTYFDKYRFEADPQLLKRVAAEMIPLLPQGAEVLAGLELGGVPIATAMSLETGSVRSQEGEGVRHLPCGRRPRRSPQAGLANRGCDYDWWSRR